jgi:hypothetical protein
LLIHWFLRGAQSDCIPTGDRGNEICCAIRNQKSKIRNPDSLA